MRRPLSQLPPGTRFLQPDLQIIGLLVTVSDSRATIQLERPQRIVEFRDPEDGTTRSFVASNVKTTSWAPSVSVIPLDAVNDPEIESETDMKKATAKKTRVPKTTKGERELKKRERAKAKAEKAAAPKKPRATKAKAEKAPKPPKADKPHKADRPPKAPKLAAETKTKKVSALDAAAIVLEAVGQPMTCQAMIDEMAAMKLWTSPGGKTPAATLYAAIGREIANKGNEARFVKADRGTFAAK